MNNMKTMNKLMLLIAFGLWAGIVQAQTGNVGINTDAPATTLEVNRLVDLSNHYPGIIAPHVSGDELHGKPYDAVRDGAFVFVTAKASDANQTGQTIHVKCRGYYYYDKEADKWMPFVPCDGCGCKDNDGDGVNDFVDPDPADPCNPAQQPGYTGYDGTNTIWRAADCDGDGETNGTEHDCGSDPYDDSVQCTIPGNISALTNCDSPVVSGNIIEGQAVTGVTATLTYNGGNGGYYQSQNLISTGVTGLTATLPAGNFANGNGVLVYTISGTPVGNGTANFAISIGGQSCTMEVPVSALDCETPGAITITCNDDDNKILVGETTGFSMTGGQPSTQISWQITKSDNTVFKSGTGTSTGDITFDRVDTYTCEFSATNNATPAGCSVPKTTVATALLQVQAKKCKVFMLPNQLTEFMCHNMGADQSLDPHDITQPDAWALNGSYIAWGRNHDMYSTTNDPANGFWAAPTATNPNNSVAGWNTTSYAPNGAWNNPANQPCPSGYRLPTIEDWKDVLKRNTNYRFCFK